MRSDISNRKKQYTMCKVLVCIFVFLLQNGCNKLDGGIEQPIFIPETNPNVQLIQSGSQVILNHNGETFFESDTIHMVGIPDEDIALVSLREQDNLGNVKTVYTLYSVKQQKFITENRFLLPVFFGSDGLSNTAPAYGDYAGRIGYINKQGDFITMPIYSIHSTGFTGGRAIADGDDGSYIIDSSGTIVGEALKIGDYQRFSFASVSDPGMSLATNRYGYKYSRQDYGIDYIHLDVIAPYVMSARRKSDSNNTYTKRFYAEYTIDYERYAALLDLDGNIIVSVSIERFRPRFDHDCIYLQSNGTVIVQEENDLFRLYNGQGDPISSAYHDIFNAKEGLSVVMTDDTWLCGYIDEKGKEVIEPIFTEAKPFSEGLAFVKDASDGLYSCIDTSANYVIPPSFIEVGMFSDGYSAVKPTDDSGWGVIDRNGRWIISPDPQYTMIFPFKNGLATIILESAKHISDPYNESVPFFMYATTKKRQESMEGRDIVKSILVDTDGNTVFNGYDAFVNLDNGLILTRTNISDTDFKRGLLNADGKVIIPPTYDSFTIAGDYIYY